MARIATVALLDNLEEALAAARTFNRFEYSNDSLWSIRAEERGGEITGNLIVTCADAMAIVEFTDILQREGHMIEHLDTGDVAQNAIVVIPDGADAACPLMCAGCPILPVGIRAQLTDASTITNDELLGYRIGQEWKVFRQWMTGLIRITAKVTSSRNPAAEIGSTATMVVSDPGPGATDIANLVRKCPGPRWLGWKRLFQWFFLGKSFTIRRVCGSLGPQYRHDD